MGGPFQQAVALSFFYTQRPFACTLNQGCGAWKEIRITSPFERMSDFTLFPTGHEDPIHRCYSSCSAWWPSSCASSAASPSCLPVCTSRAAQPEVWLVALVPLMMLIRVVGQYNQRIQRTVRTVLLAETCKMFPLLLDRDRPRVRRTHGRSLSGRAQAPARTRKPQPHPGARRG